MAKKTTKIKSGTAVLPCTCADEYQDTRYGKGRRVWNLGPKHKTCTKCGVKALP